MQWKSMNDEELLLQGGKVIEQERAQTILLLEFLQEVDRRRLHLKRGYPSLFELLTKYFKYCAGSAQIRINSMRLITDVPEVKDKLATGSISLTAAAQVQTFLRQERKLEHVYSREQKIDLVEMCEGKTTREVEQELAELNPEFVNRESVRAVGAERSRVTMIFSNRFLEKVNQLKAHFSHSNPSMSFEQIFERLADKELAQIEREPRKRRSRRVQTKQNESNASGETVLNLDDSSVAHASNEDPRRVESNEFTEVRHQLHAHEVKSQELNAQRMPKRTRHIPASIKREVNFKARERGCEYVDHQTGKRCGSKFFLQLDHRKPFSLGGEHTVENLRLLCGAHNRFEYREIWRRQNRGPMDLAPLR